LGNSIRVLSANLWNGRADAEAFAELVVALAVDVVAVQELSHEQAEALSAVLPHGQLEPEADHQGMGIAMTRPGRYSRMQLPQRDGRIATLHPGDWPQLDQPLEIINLHIMAPQLLYPQPSFLVRPRQIRGVERYIQQHRKAQRVVVGDFNATPSWPLYWRMASQLTDAAVAVAERAGRRPASTWGPWFGSPRLIRIDHGFVGGVEVDDFRVVDIPQGDHSAVVMDVVPGTVPGVEGKASGISAVEDCADAAASAPVSSR
jgi:endonuclease/exonuclease/phosphatase family metal-dependent hydrolase